jgi:hypothetical protein
MLDLLPVSILNQDEVPAEVGFVGWKLYVDLE